MLVVFIWALLCHMGRPVGHTHFDRPIHIAIHSIAETYSSYQSTIAPVTTDKLLLNNPTTPTTLRSHINSDNITVRENTISLLLCCIIFVGVQFFYY
jgi:hypothetical protein